MSLPDPRDVEVEAISVKIGTFQAWKPVSPACSCVELRTGAFTSYEADE